MEEKVALAKDGDKEAFSDLIEWLKMDLYKIAKTKLQSEDDIADAIQDTIISAYQSISKLKKLEKFKEWLIKILINKCNDIYKKRKKVKSFSLDSMAEETYSFCPKEFGSIEIEDVLQSLSEEEKLIITLYYLEDYTSKEIASLLGKNENTIKTKIARAKAKIKNYFRGGIFE